MRHFTVREGYDPTCEHKWIIQGLGSSDIVCYSQDTLNLLMETLMQAEQAEYKYTTVDPQCKHDWRSMDGIREVCYGACGGYRYPWFREPVTDALSR